MTGWALASAGGVFWVLFGYLLIVASLHRRKLDDIDCPACGHPERIHRTCPDVPGTQRICRGLVCSCERSAERNGDADSAYRRSLMKTL